MQRFIFDKECAEAGAPELPVMSLKLVGPVISRFGTPHQKRRFLPRIISGEDYWCQGYSEPGAGSDLASLKTSAQIQGQEYVINGSKIWTTHAHHANWMFALVRTDGTAKRQAGISFLLVPMHQAGITVRPIDTLAGNAEVNQVFFDAARTPVENLVGAEGQGWEIAKFLLENERGGTFYSPTLLADLKKLERQHALHRQQVSRDWVRDCVQGVRLTRLQLEASALEVTELRIVDELMRGKPSGPQASLVKLIGSSIRQAVNELAMEMLGHDGLQFPTREEPLHDTRAPASISSVDAQMAAARYLDSRACSIFGGSDEIQKTIIAKAVLGL